MEKWCWYRGNANRASLMPFCMEPMYLSTFLGLPGLDLDSGTPNELGQAWVLLFDVCPLLKQETLEEMPTIYSDLV